MTRLYALLISVIAAAAITLCALPADTYAPHSVLAEGRWVKISVPQTGLYRITPAQLRAWGFSSPDKVRVFGYGGRRIADKLVAANYIDDLPLVQTVSSERGITFYAAGPDELVAQGGDDNFIVRTSPYTTVAYYFLSESDTAPRAIDEAGVAEADGPATSFVEVLHHERDLVSPGEAGPMLVGEEFRLTPRRSFTFDAPGRVDGEDLRLTCGFLAVTPSAASYVDFTVNGQELERNSTSSIPTMSTSTYQHSMMTVARHTFKVDPAERLKIDVAHVSPSSAVYNAWLNYLTVNYRRHLAMPSSGCLEFRSSSSRLRLDGAAAGVTVWDVTDPRHQRHALRRRRRRSRMDQRLHRPAPLRRLPQRRRPARAHLRASRRQHRPARPQRPRHGHLHPLLARRTGPAHSRHPPQRGRLHARGRHRRRGRLQRVCRRRTRRIGLPQVPQDALRPRRRRTRRRRPPHRLRPAHGTPHLRQPPPHLRHESRHLAHTALMGQPRGQRVAPRLLRLLHRRLHRHARRRQRRQHRPRQAARGRRTHGRHHPRRSRQDCRQDAAVHRQVDAHTLEKRSRHTRRRRRQGHTPGAGRQPLQQYPQQPRPAAHRHENLLRRLPLVSGVYQQAREEMYRRLDEEPCGGTT